MNIAIALKTPQKLFFLANPGQIKNISTRISQFIYRRWQSFGLRRDLDQDFANPSAKIEITVREITETDIPKLFDLKQTGLASPDIYELSVRKKFLSEKIGKCYVAVTADGEPCYLQFLMSSKDNQKIQVSFDGRIPLLKEDEALIENAFTPPRFRGLGIMPAAMAQIAEKAKAFDARWVMTFVAHDNIPSLKGCNKSGFYPFLERIDTTFLNSYFKIRKFRYLDQQCPSKQ